MELLFSDGLTWQRPSEGNSWHYYELNGYDKNERNSFVLLSLFAELWLKQFSYLVNSQDFKLSFGHIS